MKNSAAKIPTVDLYGVRFSNLAKSAVIEYILDFVRGNTKGFVVTPNVDQIVKLRRNAQFRNAYDEAAMVLADGMPPVLISKIAGKPIIEKLSGSDLFLDLIKTAQENDLSVFLLGAAEEINLLGEKKLRQEYPQLSIAGRYAPPVGFENDAAENEKIIRLINRAAPAFLFLFLGSPKQEIWIRQNIEKLRIKMAFCLGATLDFYAGKIRRAPLWMQNAGLEWIWRMFGEPRRLGKRYLIDDMFPFARIAAAEIWKSKGARKPRPEIDKKP